MDRRTVLLGIGTTAVGSVGIASALGAFDEPAPYTLRAMQAEGDETDVTCDLPASVVDEHPPLADVLSRARQDPENDLMSRPIQKNTAARILSSLTEACEETGGLYFYDGDAFFISIRATNPEDAHSGDGHEHSH